MLTKRSEASGDENGFSPDLGGENGGVLSMRMQVILDSSFAHPGSAPIWGGKKGEFRDWTMRIPTAHDFCVISARKLARVRAQRKKFPSS